MEFKKGKKGITIEQNIFIGSEKYENKVVTKKELNNILGEVIFQDLSVSLPQPEVVYKGDAIIIRRNLTKDTIKSLIDNGVELKIYMFRENNIFKKSWTHPEPGSIKTKNRDNLEEEFALQTEWNVLDELAPVLSIPLLDFLKPITYQGDGGPERVSPAIDAPWYEVRLAGSQKRKIAPIKKSGRINLEDVNFMRQVRYNHFNFCFAYVIIDGEKKYLGPLSEILSADVTARSNDVSSYGCIKIINID